MRCARCGSCSRRWGWCRERTAPTCATSSAATCSTRSSPTERDAVAAHLASCPDCAARARRAGRACPRLVAAADGLEIPCAAGRRSRSACSTRSRASGRGRRAAALPAVPLQPRRRARRGRVVLGAAAAAFALTVSPRRRRARAPPAYDVVMRSPAGASARAALEPERGGTELHLSVRGLPPGGKAVYEVRCERAGWSASAGTFRADARGRAYVVLTTAARLGEYERIRVVRRANHRETDVMTGKARLRSEDPDATARSSPCSSRPPRWPAAAATTTTRARARPPRRRRQASRRPAAAGATVALSAPADGALKFDQSSLSAKPGKVTIKFTNPSSVPHAVEIEGNGVEAKTDVVTKSDASVSADLKPGTYTYFCPVDGPPGGGHGGQAHGEVSRCATARARKSKIRRGRAARPAGARSRRAARAAARSGPCRASACAPSPSGSNSCV